MEGAAPWLAVCLSLALAAATAGQGSTRVLFPDELPPPDDPKIGNPKATLELPGNMNLNDLGTAGLTLINSINDITEFASLFNISLPEEDLVVRVGGAVEVATMARCQPEVQTVPLDLPVEANTIYYPTCVRVEQCGGCCFGPLLACHPTQTTEVTVKVMKTAVAGTSARGMRERTRRRRDTEQSFHKVQVLKHEACECGCKVQEEHCNLAIHNYMESECACVCKNRDAKAQCEQQQNTKYWDNDSCTCYCRRPLDCGSGEYFSPNSCRCERQ